MALRDRLPFQLPFGQDPGRSDTGPTDSMLGHSPPAATPDDMPMPRVGAVPLGQSGRANFWGLPQPDELNQQLIGPQGLRRLNEMYRTDAHVRRLVLAAWSPLVAGTWTLEPFGGEDTTDRDKQIADDIWWILTEFMSPNFTEHLYQAGPLLLRSGFLPFEQLWATVKRNGKTLLAPRKLDLRLPSSVWRWWQDDFGELTHIGQILPNRGDVIIPATDLVYYRLGAEGDNWQGTSLLRHAYKNWYLKDKLERIDAIGQERKAVGVPVVYPPTGANPQQKTQLEQLLASLHTSEVAYLFMPGPKAGSQGANGTPHEEWLLDIVKFDSSSGEGIMSSIAYHQTAISSSFLTDFLELGHHQVGARATADVQEDPFLTAVNGALLPPVVPPLNALIDRIRRLNWDAAEGSPTLKLTLHDEASLSEIAAYVAPLVQNGAMQVDPELEDYLRDRGGLPAANPDVRAKKQAATDAGLQAATDLATSGETLGEEPLSPNASPGQDGSPSASASQGQSASGGNPIAGAVKNTGKIPSSGKQLDAPVDESAVKWFERLLSQDRLREAFDGARDHIEQACAPQALLLARQLAHQAANNAPLTSNDPPVELVDALASHYAGLYALGQATVATELQKQRAALAKTLDDPLLTAAGATAAGSRLARARARGEHSARAILSAIQNRLRADQITALKTPAALQTAAENAATAQLRVEALQNTAVSVNDGRYDGAMSSGDVIGGVYTSVLDGATCDVCEGADTGDILPPEQAIQYGPPNPDCKGGLNCRCAIVWTISNDPAALAAVLGAE